MPELPEVETVVRSLRPLLVGRRLTAVALPSLESNGSGGRVLRRLLNEPAAAFQKAFVEVVNDEKRTDSRTS